MSSKNRAKASAYRNRPEVRQRKQMERAAPTEANARRKQERAVKRKLQRGY